MLNVKVGDLIKAFEFEPMSDRPDRFVIGAIDRIEEHHYVIKGETIIKDTCYGEARMQEGVEVRVPFKTLFDYEGRIVALSENWGFTEAYHAENLL